MTQEAIEIATLKANYHNMSNWMKEMSSKIDKMDDKLDKLTEEWQKFGGLYNQLQGQNDRINKCETRIENNEKFKDEMKMWKVKVITWVSVLGSVIVIAWSVLGDFIKDKIGI